MNKEEREKILAAIETELDGLLTKLFLWEQQGKSKTSYYNTVFTTYVQKIEYYKRACIRHVHLFRTENETV